MSTMNLTTLKTHLTSLFHNLFSRNALPGYNALKGGKDKNRQEKAIFVKTQFYSILEG